MKRCFKIVFLLFLFMNISCQNKSKSIVKHHKSHEKNRANAPFSDVVQVNNLYFLTGQIGKNHNTGQIVKGGIKAETEQAILNIQDVLKQHNLTLNNVLKCTVILSNIEDFAKMNTIYRSFFKDNLPARTTFAATLVAGAKIEIEVIAASK